MVILPNGQPQFVGATLDDRERNFHDDSDFYAVVWDEAKGGIDRIDYGTTRAAWMGGCTVDATPEVVDKANAWAREQLRPLFRRQMEARAAAIEVGCEVKTTTTRGKNVGKSGRVTWIGVNQFKPVFRGGYNKPEQRVRVVTDSGEAFFTDLKNVQRTDCKPIDEQALEYRVQSATWYTYLQSYSPLVMLG
jgi:hypothetical protein